MNATQLRTLCESWPGVSFDTKWGDDFVASVDGKMFAICRARDSEPNPLYFKVPDERFLELTDQPGIEPAPYLARAKWVMLPDARAFGPAWLQDAIRTAYERVAARLSKKRQRELGLL